MPSTGSGLHSNALSFVIPMVYLLETALGKKTFSKTEVGNEKVMYLLYTSTTYPTKLVPSDMPSTGSGFH